MAPTLCRLAGRLRRGALQGFLAGRLTAKVAVFAIDLATLVNSIALRFALWRYLHLRKWHLPTSMADRASPLSLNRYALRRFALKLVVLTLFAFAHQPSLWGFGRAMATLTLLTGWADLVLALIRSERPLAPTLTYWDEAASFLALAGLFRALT